MGPVSRRVRGYFLDHDPSPHPQLRSIPAAYVKLDVEIDGASGSVRFLIDTGADFTTVSPQDCIRIFGWSYVELDFSDPAARIEMIGIGSADAGAVVRDALLTAAVDDGEDIKIFTSLGIVRPYPLTPAAHGNWLMPSLLGRDVLQYFDLHLGYHPPSVVLEEASASS